MNKEIPVIDDDIVFITMGKMSLLYSYDKVGQDAMNVYLRYMYVCRMQQTNSVWATDSYMMKGLGWGKEKFYKAKALLKELSLIELKKTRSDDGTLGKSYIVVKTKITPMECSSVPVNKRLVKPESGKQETNALTNNINALTNKENAYIPDSQEKPQKSIGKKEKYLDIWLEYADKYSVGITKHRSISQIHQKTVKIFDMYTEDEIRTAIDTYCQTLNSDLYFYSYPYASINSFAEKIDQWLDDKFQKSKLKNKTASPLDDLMSRAVKTGGE